MAKTVEQLWPKIEETAPPDFLEQAQRRAILMNEAQNFARLLTEEPDRLDELYLSRSEELFRQKELAVSPVTRGKANDLAVARHSVWRACHHMMSDEATAE